MNYKIRPGIVLSEICGKHFLIAAYEARRYCSGISEMNSTGALIWRMISNGMNEQEIVEAIADEYETNDIDLLQSVQDYISLLIKEGYLQEG